LKPVKMSDQQNQSFLTKMRIICSAGHENYLIKFYGICFLQFEVKE
jgi:hypothetical protein